MKKVEGFGWGHNLELDHSTYSKEDVLRISETIDKEVEMEGVGFFICAFLLGWKDIRDFQIQAGYFPYDAYISLWDRYTEKQHGYMERNKCLYYLTENEHLKKTGDCYFLNKKSLFLIHFREGWIDQILEDDAA